MRAPLIRFYLERAVVKNGLFSIERLTERNTWEVVPADPKGFWNHRQACECAVKLGVAKNCYIRGLSGGKFRVTVPFAKKEKEKRYSSRNTL